MPVNARSLANLNQFKRGYDERRNMDGPPPGFKNPIRKVSQDWINRVAHVIFHEDEQTFAEFLKDPGITAAERMVAKIVERVYKTGDPQALSILLDRFIGKVEQKVAVEPIVNSFSLENVSDDELAKREALLSEANGE